MTQQVKRDRRGNGETCKFYCCLTILHVSEQVWSLEVRFEVAGSF